MRVCKFGIPTGQPCVGGWSKLILCEKDSVIRCMKDCMPHCPAYQGTTVESTGDRRQAAGKTADGRRQAAGMNVSQTPSAKSSGGCCGGANQSYASGGQNISY